MPRKSYLNEAQGLHRAVGVIAAAGAKSLRLSATNRVLTVWRRPTRLARSCLACGVLELGLESVDQENLSQSLNPRKKKYCPPRSWWITFFIIFLSWSQPPLLEVKVRARNLLSWNPHGFAGLFWLCLDIRRQPILSRLLGRWKPKGTILGHGAVLLGVWVTFFTEKANYFVTLTQHFSS